MYWILFFKVDLVCKRFLITNMKFIWNWWTVAIKRMNCPIYSQENMVLRSYILFSLLLSSCFLEYRVRKYLKDDYTKTRISQCSPIFYHWINHCPDIWFIGDYGISACFPKPPEKVNCTVLSLPYSVREEKELYVNIQTETRNCADIRVSSCTGKFSLSIHYQIK